MFEKGGQALRRSSMQGQCSRKPPIDSPLCITVRAAIPHQDPFESPKKGLDKGRPRVENPGGLKFFKGLNPNNSARSPRISPPSREEPMD